MEKRAFGPTGAKLPVIGQGTWQMEQDGRAEAVRALRRGLDLGMMHIDTAEMYGSGRVEEIVGEAIAGRRDEVYLVSKVLPSNASRQGTIEACERSLRHLRTDRLDLYLLHWPGSHPLEETFGAFEKLRKDGKICAWGVSNFDVDGMEKALAVAGPGKIVCNQVLYHVEERAIEHEMIPWCEAHGVAVVAYSPLGQGRLPSSTLGQVARARGVTPAAMALAFLARRAPVFAIPKASRAAHVEENARAGDLELTEAEVARIDKAFPRGARRGLPML
jgi:diketogulonate reductase-like aldo/keto reductase